MIREDIGVNPTPLPDAEPVDVEPDFED
jgi:hypothetical protein